ncbi:MAG: PaaX family transcriptional regulator C-terminal domain-containing protein [Gemmatimonadales bacterium]
MTQQTLPALRSQDLVFTLYGDYLLDKEGPVWTGSLITLLGDLSLSPMAVRTVLSRMVRKGWLTAQRRGNRSFHGLTRQGARLLQAGQERIHHPPKGDVWDGSWHVVSYTIPEQRRQLRDKLRVRLKWLGCGALSNGLMITPHDIRREVQEIAESLRITKYVEVFRAAHVGFSSLDRMVSQCWDLAAIDRRYASFIARWSISKCRTCGLSVKGQPIHAPCIDHAACFRRRFLLVHEYRSFPLDDPYLPKALLPAGWHGDEAARLFEAYHTALAGPAKQYVENVCRFAERAEVA